MKTAYVMRMWRALGWILLVGAAAQAGVVGDSQSAPLPAALVADGETVCIEWVDWAGCSGKEVDSGTPSADTWVPSADPVDEASCMGMTLALDETADQAAEWPIPAHWSGDSSLGSEIELIRLEEAGEGFAPAPLDSGAEEARRATDVIGSTDAIAQRDLDVPDTSSHGKAACASPEYLPSAVGSSGWSGGIDPVTYQAGVSFFRPTTEGRSDADYGDCTGTTSTGRQMSCMETYPKGSKPASVVTFAAILASLPWCAGRRVMAPR